MFYARPVVLNKLDHVEPISVNFSTAKLMISALWRQECQNCSINNSCVCVSLRKYSNRNSQQRINITFCVKFPTYDSEACSMLSEACGTDVRNWAFCGGIHSSNRVEKTWRLWKGRLSENTDALCSITRSVWNAALWYLSYPASSISYHMIR